MTYFDTTAKKILGLLFFLVPIIFSKLNLTATFELVKMNVLYTSAVLIALIWWIQSISKNKIEIINSPLNVSIVVYLFFMLISTLLSSNVPLSLWGKIDMPMGAFFPTVALCFIFFAIQKYCETKEDIKGILNFFLLGHFLISAYSILQHYDFDPIDWWGNKQALGRSFGTVGQANGLAAYLGAGLPLVFIFAVNAQKSIKKWLYTFYWFIAVFGFMCAGSRSGLIATTSGLFFMFIYLISKSRERMLLRKKIKFLSALLVSSIIAINIYFWVGNPELIDKSVPSALVSGISARSYVWKGAIEMWRDNPLIGVGPENFGDLYYLYSPIERNVAESWENVWTKAHNEFVQILATTGLFGFISYAIIGLGFLFYLIKSHKNKNTKSAEDFLTKNLSESLFISYLIIQISNLVGFSFVPTAMIVFLFPALSIRWKILCQDTPVGSINIKLNLNKWKSVASILAGLVLATTALYAELNYWLSDYHRGLAMMSFYNKKNLDEATEEIKTAIQFYPRDAEYWFLKSKIESTYANVLLASGKKDQAELYKNLAIKSSDKSIQINPHREDLWRVRAFIISDLTGLDTNLVPIMNYSMLRAIDLNPNGAINYLHLGRMYLSQNLVGQAIEQFRTSIKLKYDYEEPRIELIGALYKAGLTQQAQTEVVNYINKNPKQKIFLDSILNTIITQYKDNYAATKLTEYRKKTWNE